MGIVFVLLLGEIDLSVGYVSGVAGVIAAVLLIPDGNEVPAGRGDRVALLAAGVAIGMFHGLLITKIGIPSFVVTLAGLLGVERRRAAPDRRPRHRRPPEQLPDRPRQRLPVRLARWLCVVARRRSTRPSSSTRCACARKAGLGHDPFALSALRDRGARVAARRGRRTWPTRTAGSRTCLRGRRRVCPVLDLRARAHPLRPPHLRRRRQHRGGAPRRHQRRPHQDRGASRSAR